MIVTDHLLPHLTSSWHLGILWVRGRACRGHELFLKAEKVFEDGPGKLSPPWTLTLLTHQTYLLDHQLFEPLAEVCSALC